jgi:hypothetical protein
MPPSIIGHVDYNNQIYYTWLMCRGVVSMPHGTVETWAVGHVVICTICNNQIYHAAHKSPITRG